MAYLQALAGIARSGVTYAGWVHPSFVITLGATTRTSSILRSGWMIAERMGAPATCAFTLHGVTPTMGHDVKVRYAGGSDYLFGGTLLQAEAEVLGPNEVFWHCMATGYQWLLGHFTAEKSYTNTSINTILADLVATFTDGDFRVGYCPVAERVSVDFARTPLPQAFDTLAQLVPGGGAWWEVTPEKVINLCGTYPDTDRTLADGSDVRSVRLVHDMTQARTRTRVIGRDTTTTAAADVGATSIAVSEIGWFSLGTIGAASGEALIGTNVITYTGIASDTGVTSVDYGPGTLTGVTGVVAGIPEGERVAIVYTHDDLTAQSDMAAALGSPSSGIITYWIEDRSLSLSACKARAEADVAQFGAAVAAVEYHTDDRQTRIGRIVAASVTTPVAIAGDYRIQQVTTTPRGTIHGSTVELDRAIVAGAAGRQVSDFLQRIN